MNKYIERVLADTKAKNANEPEFLQTVEEVLSSLEQMCIRDRLWSCANRSGALTAPIWSSMAITWSRLANC